jgi:hypothetical protein
MPLMRGYLVKHPEDARIIFAIGLKGAQEDWNGLKFSTISAHKKRGLPTSFKYLTY